MGHAFKADLARKPEIESLIVVLPQVGYESRVSIRPGLCEQCDKC